MTKLETIPVDEADALLSKKPTGVRRVVAAAAAVAFLRASPAPPAPKKSGHPFANDPSRPTRCLTTLLRFVTAITRSEGKVISKREGYSPRWWKCRKRRRAPRASAAARRRLSRERRDDAWPRWTASRIASKDAAHCASGSFPCSRILSV